MSGLETPGIHMRFVRYGNLRSLGHFEIHFNALNSLTPRNCSSQFFKDQSGSPSLP
jgi:hypothetical protein